MKLAVDMGAILFRAWKSKDEGDPESRAIRAVDAICQRYEPTSVVIGLDHEESIRKQRYPFYKANRPPKPEGYDQVKLQVELALAERWPVASRPGWEADDILAFYALKNWPDEDVILATHDKDLFQLVGDDPGATVNVHNVYDGKLYDTMCVKNRYGVYPSQMVDYLAIVGDPVDDIPGVKGLGPVKARQILQNVHTVDAALAMGLIRRSAEPEIRIAQWLIRLMPERPEPQK